MNEWKESEWFKLWLDLARKNPIAEQSPITANRSASSAASQISGGTELASNPTPELQVTE
jgi:hypothetical protein